MQLFRIHLFFCAKDVVDPEQLNVSINTSDAMTRNVIFGINLSFK